MSTHLKRAPRRRLSADERRAEIADSAVRLALHEGLHAVTHRAVAKQLGVTHTLVVHYAPSIEDVRAAAYRAILFDELQSFRTSIDAQPTAITALTEVIRRLSQTGRENFAGVWLDGWSLGRTTPQMAKAARELMDEWQDLLANVFRSGDAAQEFSIRDPEAGAWEFIALLDGFNAHTLVAYGNPDEYAVRLATPLEYRLGLPIGTLTCPMQRKEST